MIRAISYGGGVQSTALLVLAAQGRIDFPLFLMANVGDDSEHPATLDYLRDVAIPYAEEHDIELVVLEKKRRDGTTRTLWQHLHESKRSLPIPVRMANGAPGNRTCTVDYKIKVIGKELKRRGASESNPAVVGIGISLDEIRRASRHNDSETYRTVVYPLIGIGEDTGLKMNRLDCERVIRDSGLPVPPKSSCFFCPFHRPTAWADLAREHPDLYEKSIQLEDTLNARRDTLGKDHVFLTRFGIPLRDAIDTDQELLPLVDDGSCDSGWCFT